jgi:hypothetical protein
MLRHRLLLARRDDEGSVMLALFAIMVISSLLVVIASTVVSGAKQTVSDQRFEQALEVAEVGLSQMNSLVQSNPKAISMAPITGTTQDGGSYSVSATKSNYVWTVTSVGTSSGASTADRKTRTVSNNVSVTPLFNMAAFGKVEITFLGGNGADSYNSTWNSDICAASIGYNSSPSANYVDPGLAANAFTSSSSTNVSMCQPTQQGAAGTNGELSLQGGVADKIDSANIYNAKDHILDPLPNATGTCIGVTATCDLYNTGRLTYTREPVPFPNINSCNFPAGSTPVNSTGGGSFGGRAYNLGDVTLDGSTVFTGTTSQPTVLCVSGTLSIAPQQLINFTTGTHSFIQSDGTTRLGLIPRPPASLLIYVTGTSNSGVSMGDHASISAAIYAPNAAIVCGPQGNVYGSLVANSIDNKGGWNFHYDDALRDQMANAPVRISNWVEVH